MRVLSSLFVVALLSMAAACAPDGGGSDTIPGDTAGDGDGDGDTTTAGDGDGDTTTAGDGDGDDSGGPDGPPPPPPPPDEVCDQIDIMFVIDDSGSMAQEQENLAANFPKFIDVLDGFVTEGGEPIDYRVALTSTGVSKSWSEELFPGIPVNNTQTGMDGAFVQAADCGMSRRWIEKADTDPATQFACAAQLGTNGPANEMPLAALKQALENPTNNGFSRPDALLGIVILTDEDDCSREDNNFSIPFLGSFCESVEAPSSYKSFLDGFTGGEGRWAIATIAGPSNCSSEFGDAVAATRLLEFVGLAGATGVFSSICEGDLTNALNDALMTFDTACQNLPRPD